MSRVVDGELVQCVKAPREFAPPDPRRIKPKSAKLVRAEVVYRKNRARRLEMNPVCQRCTLAPAIRTHHILPRSAGGGHGLHNLLACCENCHDEIHLAPADAYREGWMRRKHPKPGDAHWTGDAA